MRKISARPIACLVIALIGATILCLAGATAVWTLLDAQARQLPFIEANAVAALISEAQARDQSAEITTVAVACRLGPWQCYWDPSGTGSGVSPDLADQILKQIVRVDGPTNVDFILSCAERFDEGPFEPGYACTWDPGTGPRSLPVR